ncbi:peptidase [Shewanella colwelliana]|uniref:Peptidase n=1 Tax=Shewanella colwelliana TaxID=23 RepID=A0ABQ4NW65_SHECO|nr:PepSY-associated TM helix domain-containing protein [Shewanella colwelliana]GIU37658.1 peptidase [Shewanella colwelliana]
MKETFFRSMSWLHTWAGLLVCWLLLVIFFAGTLSYFRHEITLWSKPELHSGILQSYSAQKVEQQLTQGQNYLNEQAPDARSWYIELPSTRKPYLSFNWQDFPEPGQRRGQFNQHQPSEDGQQVVTNVRDSKGGNFFYRLHFDLHYIPVGLARWIVGFATMFMLIALISGIVIHKRIFKDFFSFRRGKASRTWLDAHNISSVIALPYHLMITYTGLIALMFMYMPWGVLTNYDGDTKAFRQALNPTRVQIQPSGEPANLIAINTLLPQVRALWGDLPIKQVVISYPMDTNSRISFYQNSAQSVSEQKVAAIFSGVSGELLYATPDEHSTSRSTYDTMMALHTARFSNGLLRGLFFLSGLLGCAMIATGTLLWAVKITQKQQRQLALGAKPSIGLRLVNGLNLTLIAGLPLATAVFFYANRLIPSAIENRSQWEVHSFFITLGLIATVALIDGVSLKQSKIRWQQLAWACAALFAGIPLLNALTSPSNLWQNMQTQQWSLVGFDLLCVLSAIIMFKVARKLSSSHQQSALSPRQRATSKGNS